MINDALDTDLKLSFVKQTERIISKFQKKSIVIPINVIYEIKDLDNGKLICEASIYIDGNKGRVNNI